MSNFPLSVVILSISVRPIPAVFRRSHLALNPGPVVRDPAVHPVFAGQSTTFPKADVPDEDMLLPALVGEWTAGVSLAAVLT